MREQWMHINIVSGSKVSKDNWVILYITNHSSWGEKCIFLKCKSQYIFLKVSKFFYDDYFTQMQFDCVLVIPLW